MTLGFDFNAVVEVDVEIDEPLGTKGLALTFNLNGLALGFSLLFKLSLLARLPPVEVLAGSLLESSVTGLLVFLSPLVSVVFSSFLTALS